jgi:uncharacterized protein YcbK (DUF882 family)
VFALKTLPALILLACLQLFSPAPAEAQTLDWKTNLLNQDRCLTLTRVKSKETRRFCYWRKSTGQLDRQGYTMANWMLRDVDYNAVVYMDPTLLDTLFIIQQWLILEGRNGEIQVLSGYRTPEHNKRTRGSAKNSQHMRGTASDLHVPGVSTKLLAAMGRVIGAGGVGIYIKNNFVHVDTAGVRVWAG